MRTKLGPQGTRPQGDLRHTRLPVAMLAIARLPVGERRPTGSRAAGSSGFIADQRSRVAFAEKRPLLTLVAHDDPMNSSLGEWPMEDGTGFQMPDDNVHQQLVHLVERTRNGDQRAFEALLRLLWQRVMLYVAGRGGVTGLDADAVAMDVFESLYEAIRKSNVPDGSKAAAFFAAVRTIAQRRVADYRRSRHALPEAAKWELAARRSHADDVPDHLEPEEWAAFEECLQGLDEEPRHLVLCHYFQKLSTRALERQTGTPASTVRLRIAQALRILGDCLRSRGIVLE